MKKDLIFQITKFTMSFKLGKDIIRFVAPKHKPGMKRDGDRQSG